MSVGGLDAATELATLLSWPSSAPAIVAVEYEDRVSRARELRWRVPTHCWWAPRPGCAVHRRSLGGLVARMPFAASARWRAPGVSCAAVGDAAHAVPASAVLVPDFRLPGLPHRTGHRIGLAIQEPLHLVCKDMTPPAPALCFSNEPMNVVPDRFSIRFEDPFHLTENGAEWLTLPQPSIDEPFA